MTSLGVLAEACGGLVSTDPRGLLATPDPVGPGNDRAIDEVTGTLGRVPFGRLVAAWGANRAAGTRGDEVAGRIARRRRLYCLGTNDDGSPKHTLYLPYTTQLDAFIPKVPGDAP